MYEITGKHPATPEALAAIVALNRTLVDLEMMNLISGDKAADLLNETIYLLDLEEDEDEGIFEPFWEAAEAAGVL